MENLSEKLENIQSDANKIFSACSNEQELDLAKATILGKHSQITMLFQGLMTLDPSKRKVAGQQINFVKNQIEKMLVLQKNLINEKKLLDRLKQEAIDVTLPGRKRRLGVLHPVLETRARIEKIFQALDFEVSDGPEIEDDWHNFTALNSPQDHPARSMQDTFYINSHSEQQPLLLRTHTSAMQIRFAQEHSPPFRVIMPGRTYRVDNDATHSPMFHQVEGLWIDKRVNFSNLKGLYQYFLKKFFAREDLLIRFRPSYFPFTQPSAEIDMMFESGPYAGHWLEISGAGQVHPYVLSNMGIDAEEYTGFAFGSGLERLTMLRYGVDDLRWFFSGDLRFIRQFVEI